MPIGNQKFGISRKYQYQIGIWYFCPQFSWYFLGILILNLVYGLLKIWLIKYWYFLAGFRGCYFIDIGLALASHFPESGLKEIQ